MSGASTAAPAAVSIRGASFFIDGRPTYEGVPAAEGRLMNCRMVNSIFEDRNPATAPAGFDPDANAAAFRRTIPQYRERGVLAFTVCLQGGFPGYEGAVNSAFEPDGSLREGYLARAARAIEACRENGVAVILGLFYQRQSGLLEDEEAVRRGVENACLWVAASGYRNVLVEIANEYPHPGFRHAILKEPGGVAELVELARATAPGLLVSASGYGDGLVHEEVARASDFVLIHGNSIDRTTMAERARSYAGYGKPVLFNEDDKFGADAAAACEAAFAAGASWGYMNSGCNQYYPFEWGIDEASEGPVFEAIERLVRPA
jgi:hypothetical protein